MTDLRGTAAREERAVPAGPSRRTAAGRVLAALRVPRVQVLLAAALYLGYAIAVTWPVVLGLDSRLFGAVPGDLSGAIAHAREVVEYHIFPFAPATLTDFNAPQGQPEPWVLNIATLPGTALLYGTSYLFGATAGHTLFALCGYVASGVAMFLLARRVTGSAAAALIAGFAFAFYPFAVNKGLGHLHFIHGWPLVIVAWRMLELAERPTRRNGLYAGLAVAGAMWFTPYYVLIGGVAAATLGVAVLIVAWARRRLRATVAPLAIAATVPLSLMAALGLLSIVASDSASGGLRSQSLSQLTTFSARLHEFVVPDRNNLLVGTESYLSARLHGSNFSENSLYVGLTIIALAAAAAVLTALDLRRLGRAALARISGAGALAAGLLTAAGLAFASPPQLTVAGSLIPTPSWFVFQLTSTWRVYSRFVVLIMLGLALLAAIAIARKARDSPRFSALVIALLLPVVAIDLWARPPDAVTSLATPDIYKELRSLGPGIVADYPVQPAGVPDASATYWQQAGGHPVFNGFVDGSEDEARKLEVADLADSETAGSLAAFGVRWVLVRPRYAGGAPTGGFQRVFQNPEGTIYRVTAPPARTGVDALSASFSPPEGPANEQYRWLAYSEGQMLVWGDCDPCAGELRFASSSQARMRTLTVSDPGGRVLHRQTIPTTPVEVRVPLRFRRETEITLRIDPPGEAVATPGSTDTRQLGIIVAEPRFRPGVPARR